ncbi:hypothetical protein IEO21_02569 [Rhodonia placenta]|uniref:Uncharacterized protein n=1 Tax=Rhodonia placenta TaxID=104341 RepID=A0A8H7U500_9APHY|nr:hypothetical protein IEO21_02569 [Postia placenta]
MLYTQPIVDDQNPFYCPAITAVAFLESLRHQLRDAPPPYSRSPEGHDISFAERLDQSVDEKDLYRLLFRFHPHQSHDLDHNSSVDSSLSAPAYGHSTPVPVPQSVASPAGPVKVRAKRKRSRSCDTFSGLLAPPKRERSLQSVNDSSFELSAKAERLRYFKGSADALFSPASHGARGVPEIDGPLTKHELERRICILEDELYGPPIGTETPRGINTLVARLDVLLPGIRLKERLYALEVLNHQRVADILAIDGHLNARILNMLRMSEIDCLDLTASLMDEEGLNLGAQELLHVFEKPNSFLFLSELSLSGATLQDYDLTNIHHLPRLSRLWISNTGIGNEGIFHLVALKRSLTELDIALNPRVDDDAIPALITLPKLRFVSLFDTSMRMPGFRRLAVALRSRMDRERIQVEVPRECEEYLETCEELSVSALRRNLAEHAVFNASILTDGSKEEMVERLKRILTRREMDLVARDLLWQDADKILDREAVQSKSGSSEIEEAHGRIQHLIGNILILRGDIEILPPERTTVSYDFLSRLVGEYLLTSSPHVDTSAALSIMPVTRSTSICIPLPGVRDHGLDRRGHGLESALHRGLVVPPRRGGRGAEAL